MTIQSIVKINKNGTITLPKEAQRYWGRSGKTVQVFVDFRGDTISIKRLTEPALSLKEMMDEFLQSTKKTNLSKREVNQTLKKIRAKAN